MHCASGFDLLSIWNSAHFFILKLINCVKLITQYTADTYAVNANYVSGKLTVFVFTHDLIGAKTYMQLSINSIIARIFLKDTCSMSFLCCCYKSLFKQEQVCLSRHCKAGIFFSELYKSNHRLGFVVHYYIS